LKKKRNYSAISEGKHKRISNVLAGADSDNSRALVPIQATTGHGKHTIDIRIKILKINYSFAENIF
jgi:hypothetical protein